MELTFYVSAFTTLFVVVDPIGLSPIFVALTRGTAPAERRAVARRAGVIGFLILALFGLSGEALLGFLGISMAAFRIAGGALLFLTALDMLFDRRESRREGQAEAARDDPAVFPLATPLLAGPGAIAAMILLTGQAEGVVAVLGVHLVMGAVVGLAVALFTAAGPLERALGPVGTNVVTRLLGMLLAALSVQFILDGLGAVGLTAR